MIKEFPQANIESVKDNKITFAVNADETELAALNARLVAQGVKVFSFCEDKTDLEDLFMKISSDG
jgi:hypothetical protein